MSRTPNYISKLPPDLAQDPFWQEFHKPPPTSFGAASRKLSAEELVKDTKDRLLNDTKKWESTDEHLAHHGRLQVSSRWGNVTSGAPGDYDPDGDKRSKMSTFPNPVFASRAPDHFLEEVVLARTQPIKSFRIATADAEKQRRVFVKQQRKLGSPHPATRRRASMSQAMGNSMTSSSSVPSADPAQTIAKQFVKNSHQTQSVAHSSPSKSTAGASDLTGSKFQDINVEDMRKALLPAPGQYNTAIYHKLRYERSALPVIIPKKKIGQPRAKLDFESLTLVEDENSLFDGSYFQFEDPTKKQYPAYSLGVRRPISEREYVRVGPGDYNDPTTTGATSVLSNTQNLHMKNGLSSSAMRVGLSSHSFGRKTILK
jgi:hypothetical protein